jgi:hypothetical protein
VINRAQKTFDAKLFDQLGPTLTHEEILKRGILRSVVKHFRESSPEFKSKLLDTQNDDDADNLNIRNLYFKLTGRRLCYIELDYLIETVFKPNIAIIDLASKTKDLPWAHFDAESFYDSNERVIQFRKRIISAIKKDDDRNFDLARQLTAQILHTIQDFYSHSNWLNLIDGSTTTTKINRFIGTEEFNSIFKIRKFINEEKQTCLSNCKEVLIQCTTMGSILLRFIKLTGFLTSEFSCPLKYFKCDNNLIKNDKHLTSGYYNLQKLPNGKPVDKPDNGLKCSHGGIIDNSAFKLAKGGLNKDSSYYLFSPKADQHLLAAELAIQHTQFFFDDLKQEIQMKAFEKLMGLEIKETWLNRLGKHIPLC